MGIKSTDSGLRELVQRYLDHIEWSEKYIWKTSLIQEKYLNEKHRIHKQATDTNQE